MFSDLFSNFDTAQADRNEKMEILGNSDHQKISNQESVDNYSIPKPKPRVIFVTRGLFSFPASSDTLFFYKHCTGPYLKLLPTAHKLHQIDVSDTVSLLQEVVCRH